MEKQKDIRGPNQMVQNVSESAVGTKPGFMAPAAFAVREQEPALEEQVEWDVAQTHGQG